MGLSTEHQNNEQQLARAIERGLGVSAAQPRLKPDQCIDLAESRMSPEGKKSVLILTTEGVRLVERDKPEITANGTGVCEQFSQSIPRVPTALDLRELNDGSVADLNARIADPARWESKVALGLGVDGRVACTRKLPTGPHKISFVSHPGSESIRCELVPQGTSTDFLALQSALTRGSQQVIDRFVRGLIQSGDLESAHGKQVVVNLNVAFAELQANIFAHNILGLSNEQYRDRERRAEALARVQPGGGAFELNLSYRLSDKHIVLWASQPNEFPGFDSWIGNAKDATKPENLENPTGRGAALMTAYFSDRVARERGRIMEFSRPAAEIHTAILD